jgi:phospholipid/cholesterol/gamma-HCH transport system substrate-binding protein
VPYDVFRLTRVATEGIEELNTEDLNSFIDDLADLTQDRREPVTRLINSIDDVSQAITSRDQQLGELLARAETLSATLAEKDDTLVALTGLADLIAANRAALDRLLTNLQPTLDTVRNNLDDVNRSLAWAGPAFYGQALAGTHGPWLDIYVRGLGPDIAQILCDALAPGSVCS